MEGALRQRTFTNGVQSFNGKQSSGFFRKTSFRQRLSLLAGDVCPMVNLELPQMRENNKFHVKVSAVRRRRAYLQSDTYVLLEPGKSEEFVSEDELRVRLKGWLENSPGNVLPPDLARFDSIDAAVSHLVRSVCELEIDGEVGSIQWYQVQLE
ncbi:protein CHLORORESPIRATORY REDUCTION 7, chloroplastic [Elaeis guineensis]|uniref:Protein CHLORORESPIRATORY REDUCTION 7, chloroplastic n=1 Tax=Elaeis guineensis var. tenera TaxID=51953 RepID=A0A6I9QAN2_ELAGV|nr:protein CHLORORESPIRATORY REDUCTION 7, chloroplastic [Elaeis guineensis]